MPMLLTLTHHQYGCCDAKCKPAIVIHFNLQVCLSEPPFVFAILVIPSSTVVSGYFLCFSQYGGGFICLNFDELRATVPFIKH